MEGLKASRLCFLALSAALGAATLAGCGRGATGGCDTLGDCGGNPAGTWTVNGACQFQAVRPAQPVDTTDFTIMTPPLAPMLTPPQANPVLLQQSASGDWCSSLVYPPDGTITNVSLWHEAPELVEGKLTFIEMDHSYATNLRYSTAGLGAARNTTHFAPRCLMANGGNPTCDQLGKSLDAFYMPQTPTVPERFQNISCVAAPSDGGCDCTYVYILSVDDQGTWAVQGGTLVQDSTLFTFNGATAYPQSPSRSIETTFCAQPGRLELSGPNGGSLLGLQGLRSLVLVPM